MHKNYCNLRQNIDAIGNADRFFVLFLLIGFLAIMFMWASARDPFTRIEFSVRIGGFTTSGLIVMPKHEAKSPVVVYLHGAGGSSLNSGNELRQIAEENLTAIDINYNQTNQAIFNRQLKDVFNYIRIQPWANTNSIAFFGVSLGAVRSLNFILKHPEYQPDLFVQYCGGSFDEFSHADITNLDYLIRKIHCQFLLIHGANDATFPLDDCIRFKNLLTVHNIRSSLFIIPNQPHNLGLDRFFLFREAAEYCARFFGVSFPMQTNCRPADSLYWLLFFGVLFILLIIKFKTCYKSLSHFSPTGYIIAFLVVLISLGGFMAFIFPLFNCTGFTLKVARCALVGRNQREDFDWLCQQTGWDGCSIGYFLDNIDLATYNRNLINWSLGETIYRNYVLSPVITGDSVEQFNWRRPLWEEFYPHIRHENSSEDAADIVVRHLRERVTIADLPNLPHDVPTIWLRQITDKIGFQIIYVAALRSVGIPARLDQNRRAEFFDGVKWRSAPWPVIESFCDVKK